MSDLLKLETLYAPTLTVEQSQKRCALIESAIDSARDFIVFLKSLDPAMRISFLNYLHTQAKNPIQDESEELSQTYDSFDDKIFTKSLSPKKRAGAKPPKRAPKKIKLN